MDVDLGTLLAASPPRRRHAAKTSPPAPPPAASPKPSPPPAAAGASGRRQQPPRQGKEATNRYAELEAEGGDDEEEEVFAPPASPSSSSESSSSDSAPRPVGKKKAATQQAAKKPAPKKPAKQAPHKKGGSPKKAAGSKKPRAKKGEKLRQSAADAAAAAEADAAAPELSNAEKRAAIGERRDASAKLRDLEAAGTPYVRPLSQNKEGQYGVPKAPWWTPERGAAAGTLPSVASDDMGDLREGWLGDRDGDGRRDPAQRTKRQLARRGPPTDTWCSRSEQDTGPPPQQPQQPEKSWRERLDLPEQERPTEYRQRAVSLRVRFVAQTPDEAGVMGAAEPEEGKKTRGETRGAFELHGEGARVVRNAYIKIINSVPAGAQRHSLAKGNAYSFMQRVLLTEKFHAFSCKAARDTAKYKEEKQKYDKMLADVEAMRVKYFGCKADGKGKSLLDVHDWLRNVYSNVLLQAVRDVGKAYKSNLAKQKLQEERGERVVPFELKPVAKNKRSSHTFYVQAAQITARHVPRPDLYRHPSKKEAARRAAGRESGLEAHRAEQKRALTWTELTLPAVFCGDDNRLHKTVVYLTRCADLDENGRLLGDVRFTCDLVGHWSCVVQRRPVPVRPLRPVDERSVVVMDAGSRTFETCYCPDQAKVITYATGEGGVEKIMQVLFKADDIITRLRNMKRATDFKDRAAKLRYEQAVRKLTLQKLRLFIKARNLVKELHCRVARDLTANFDTIVLPPFKTKDMAQRKRRRPDGSVQYRVIRSGAVRRLLSLAHYQFRMLLEHRCLVDGSELHSPGEEYTTKACPFCGTCYDVGSNKVFLCGLCEPIYKAQRDEKGAFTIAAKVLLV